MQTRWLSWKKHPVVVVIWCFFWFTVLHDKHLHMSSESAIWCWFYITVDGVLVFRQEGFDKRGFGPATPDCPQSCLPKPWLFVFGVDLIRPSFFGIIKHHYKDTVMKQPVFYGMLSVGDAFEDFYSHPKPFDEQMFEMGWFNHRLAFMRIPINPVSTTHSIHVWFIYLYLVVNKGKYSIHGSGNGMS